MGQSQCLNAAKIQLVQKPLMLLGIAQVLIQTLFSPELYVLSNRATVGANLKFC